MARSKGPTANGTNKGSMPKFVDIKLTQDDKAEFIRVRRSDAELVALVGSLCDGGYRVGCSWSPDTQSYIVSLTCRDADSPNDGLCMSSFAKDIATALALCLFKHEHVTGGNWLGSAGRGSEDFG